MAGWNPLKEIILEEITQRKEEGCNVDEFYEKWQEACNDEKKLMEVYQELSDLPIRDDFPYYEPSELDEIKSVRPNGPRILTNNQSENEWENKFLGAWLGRSIGCALGKPLECWDFMIGTNGNPGWKNIKAWFEGANSWPIKNYVPENSTAKKDLGIDIHQLSIPSTKEHIEYLQSDDDIRYTVLGTIMLEKFGLNWDSWDVGKSWHQYLPYNYVFTAEVQAYLNFAHVTSHLRCEKVSDWEEKKKWVRTYLNPYREWIGAQIRVDGYAYGAAGNPELAAELAWRDSSFSHVKNGIYGAMFFSAIIAAAFVEKDINKLIEIGLSEIPNNCRLAHDIKKAVEIAKSCSSQVELVEKIEQTFNHYHFVHTNNNAALCVAALIYGQGDFEKSITTAVLGGWDTDCNGATVGSIIGAMVGEKGIQKHWKAPLNDLLYSEINGFNPIKISECANKSYNIFKKIKNKL